MILKERFKLICAVHLLLVKNGNILLLRRFNTGYEDGKYSVPAGHLDGRERASEAMIREAHEEICVKMSHKNLRMVHVMHRKSTEERIDTSVLLSINPEPAERIDTSVLLSINPEPAEWIDFFFEAKRWKGDIIIGELNKCDELKWASLTKLPQNAILYVKEAIKYYQKGVYFSEFGWK